MRALRILEPLPHVNPSVNLPSQQWDITKEHQVGSSSTCNEAGINQHPVLHHPSHLCPTIKRSPAPAEEPCVQHRHLRRWRARRWWTCRGCRKSARSSRCRRGALLGTLKREHTCAAGGPDAGGHGADVAQARGPVVAAGQHQIAVRRAHVRARHLPPPCRLRLQDRGCLALRGMR